MSVEMIQVFRPALGEDELRALAAVFESGWIGLGPKTAEFEQRFAEFVGAKHAIAVNSATAALHLACLVCGVGPGDEVLVPTVTFVSTAHAVLYCGAEAVFVDVDPQTLNIDPEDMERKMTPRTKAVVPVHFGGHPCPMDAVHEIAARRQIAVIEDAAHAAGSTYGERRIGGLPETDAACFSFQAVKNLPIGDGGMIVTNRDEFVPRLKRLRWCGIDKSTWDRTEEVAHDLETGTRRYAEYGWYYEVTELGFKYHMNDVNAAIGLIQLDKLPAANARRREIAERYRRAFGGIEQIACPAEQPGTQSSWHNFVIQTEDRDALNVFLRDRNIATGVHYLPIHLQPFYRNRSNATLPVAEDVWRRILTLPLYPAMTDGDVERVIAAVGEFYAGKPDSGRIRIDAAEDGEPSRRRAAESGEPSEPADRKRAG